MKKKSCFWCCDWTDWDDLEQGVYTTFTGVKLPAYIQRRKCKRCNKIEIRRVNCG